MCEYMSDTKRMVSYNIIIIIIEIGMTGKTYIYVWCTRKKGKLQAGKGKIRVKNLS